MCTRVPAQTRALHPVFAFSAGSPRLHCVCTMCAYLTVWAGVGPCIAFTYAAANQRQPIHSTDMRTRDQEKKATGNRNRIGTCAACFAGSFKFSMRRHHCQQHVPQNLQQPQRHMCGLPSCARLEPTAHAVTDGSSSVLTLPSYHLNGHPPLLAIGCHLAAELISLNIYHTLSVLSCDLRALSRCDLSSDQCKAIQCCPGISCSEWRHEGASTAPQL